MMKLFNKKCLSYFIICSLVFGCIFSLLLFVFNLDTRLAWSINSAIKCNNLFRGVVLITKNNKIIYEKSYLDKKLCDQQFLAASLMKQITCVLILKEAEKGNLDLLEKANKYLKKEQKINGDITIHHLLSHTSGIINDCSVKFVPGTQYEYSNYAYVILGYILQNVTGEKFDDTATKLFQQLGMEDSFLIDEELLANMQKNHPNFILSLLFENGEFVEISKKSTRNYIIDCGRKIFFGNSCGGLISTAYDLNKWNHMLHNGKILSTKMYEKMISKIIESNFPSGFYGYGVCSPNESEIFHIGYVSGYKSTLSYFPKYKISLVILENISVNDYKSDFKMHENIRNVIYKYIELMDKI